MASSGGNGGRSPKDLREMINSQGRELEFPDEMKINLEKLKALSKDDLTENAMLRSRIDQQAELICILKQRSDESLKKSLRLEKDNEELRQTREEALSTLQTESRKYNVLQKRFEVLNKNHEELITFKDNYKIQNEKLKRENEKLSYENKLLFAETVKKRDEEIKGLRQEIEQLQSKCISSDVFRREMETKMESLSEQSAKDKKLLEEKLLSMEKQFSVVSSQMKDEIAALQNLLQQENKKMSALQKDRDEFAQIALDRGKNLTEKQKENAQLVKRLEETERAIREMEDKFSSELQTMSTSSQVRRLKKELEEAEKKSHEQQKEYEAYKKHMSTLLNKEKTINNHLRVLIG